MNALDLKDRSVLLALLWSPPDAARYEDAASAHARGLELYQRLTGEAAPPQAIAKVEWAARRSAAADLFPGDAVDHRWAAADSQETVAHPFAGAGAPRTPILLPDHVAVDDAFDDILGALRGDHHLRRLALAVWRLLPDEFRKEGQDAIAGDSWRMRSPLAHPAYPDPVESVGAFRAAVAAAGDEPAILLFSLASVQEYIGEARRTQDLWMGSYLYAYFIWHAIRAVISELGPWSIITPNLRGHPFVDLWLEGEGLRITPPHDDDLLAIASLPNIFAAVVPRAQGEALAQAAQRSVAAARDAVANAVKQRLIKAATNPQAFPNADHSTWEALWDAQIAELATGDLFWALVPWEDAHTDRDRLATMAGLQQINEAWVNWAAAATGLGPGPGEGAGFPLAAELAARLLTARKNRRDFAQTPQGTAGGLCTLCAVRTALRPHGIAPGDFWLRLAGVSEPKLQGRIRAGERLCAPCAMKRLAGEAYFAPWTRAQRLPGESRLAFDYHRFPSTATVATAPFRARLREALRSESEDVWLALFEWLTNLDKAAPPMSRVPANVPPSLQVGSIAPDLAALDALDGSWFSSAAYQPESVLREFRLQETLEEEAKGGEVATNALGTARRDLAAVREQLKAWAVANGGIAAPPPASYYAVLALDGDKIGDWLRGNNNPAFRDILDPAVVAALDDDPWRGESLRLKRPPGPLSQMALAGAGHAFALLEAPRIVADEARGAWLVYSGGDDVLALASREAAMPLAMRLREAFCKYATSDGDLLLGAQASISAALVIAHVAAPLGGVIREANEALKQLAKAQYGRNAFVVRVLKRSGPAINAGLPWRVTHNDKEIDAASAFAAVSQAMASGLLSRGLLTDARALVPALGRGSPTPPAGSSERPRDLLLWYAERHLDTKRPPEERATVRDALHNLFDATQCALGESAKATPYRRYPKQLPAERPTAWKEMTELLRAAEFLAREDEE